MDEQTIAILGDSLIMPSVTVYIPMPQGAAAPAQAPAEAPQCQQVDADSASGK